MEKFLILAVAKLPNREGMYSMLLAMMKEPVAKVEILVPSDMVGAVMDLAQSRRGIYETMDYLDTTRVTLSYHIPLSEIIFDFFV